MRRRLMTGIVFCTLSFGIALDAFAQSANFLVSSRKGAMTLQQKYMSRLVNMAQGKVPFDASEAQHNADILAVLATLPWDDFQASTAQNPNTRAKEEVFKDAPKFKAASEKLGAEIKALVVATRSGNQATVGAAVKNAAQACNTCHDSFSGWTGRFKFE